MTAKMPLILRSPRSGRLEGRTASIQRPSEIDDGVAFQRVMRCIMDALYWLSAGIAGVTLVLIALIIPWGVFTRYVLGSAASWPEPAAILLSIVLTFFGAAACYRADVHMRIIVARDLLPRLPRQIASVVAELLVAAISLFMTVWGIGLCETTWHQTVDEFPWLLVGITYLPIPIGGVVTMLFVAERLLIGPPPETLAPHLPEVE